MILFWTLLCTTVMYLLTKTPFGQMCNAIRENPQRAEFVGYNITKVRWLAFILSAGFAGAAGSLHAINYEHIGFESVSLVQSGFVLFNAYIGGVGNFFGPIIGAITGEMINNKSLKKSLKPAFGSILGTLTGIVLKFCLSMAYFFFYLNIFWQYRQNFF